MNTLVHDDLIMNTPLALGYTMPGEWEPHRCCWMAWPVPHPQWPDLDAVEHAIARVAQAIRQFEPVKMVVSPDLVHRARDKCHGAIELVPLANDDSWMRDIGPSFLINRDRKKPLAGTAWRFNNWGGNDPLYKEDAQVARRVLHMQNLPFYNSSLTLEGGGLHVDGRGSVMTTESVVLNQNRNPGLSRDEAERELCRALGVRNVIWLPGDPESMTSDVTDGHIDGIACFVKPGVVLFEEDLSAQGDWRRLLDENYRALELAKDANGRAFEIIKMITDQSCIQTIHDVFCRSYVNFYIANGGIIMPCYGVPSDQQARDMIANVFPDRTIEMVNIDDIAPGGGGIHCITQQQPAI